MSKVFNKIRANVLRIIDYIFGQNEEKYLTVNIRDKKQNRQAEIRLSELEEKIVQEALDRGINFPNPDKHIIENRELDNNITTFPERTNLLFEKEFEVDDDAGNDQTVIQSTRYASDVPDAVETTADVGNIPTGTPASQIKGKSLTQLFDEIFFSVVIPPYALPTFTASPSASRDEERGLTLNETIIANFFKNDYGNGRDYRLIKDSITVDSVVGSFPDGQITPGYLLNEDLTFVSEGVLIMQATTDYDDAPPKDDNFGNPDPSPPLGGTLNINWTITARSPIWGGGYTLAEVPEGLPGIPNADELTIKNNFEEKLLYVGSNETIVVTPQAGDNWLLVACPPGTNVLSASDQFGNPFNTLVSNFTLLNFTDANDTVGTELTYNLHYYYSPAGFSGAQDITIEIGV